MHIIPSENEKNVVFSLAPVFRPYSAAPFNSRPIHSNVADTTIVVVVVTLLTLLTFDTAIRINYDRNKPCKPIPATLVLVSASTQQPPPPNLRLLQNIGYELRTF